MLDATRYYSDLEKLLLDTGKYVMISSLYRDLQEDTPSPKSKKVFKKNFNGNMDDLRDAYNHLYKKAPKDWACVRELLKSEGLYVRNDAVRFLRLIQRANNHTDFRTVALAWTRSQLTKLQQGKEVPIYTLHDYLASYDYLVLERRKKKGEKKHFKGLHKIPE